MQYFGYYFSTTGTVRSRLQYEIRLGSHVMCAATYVTPISLRINDVLGWASAAFYVERGSQRSQCRFIRKLS